MKIGIYGAGEFTPVKDSSIPFIGVDGGLNYLSLLGIVPIYIIGDFDSYKKEFLNEQNNVKILPSHKDFTDTEMAIKEAIKKGYDEIELYGVTGGRLDHFFTIMRLLVAYYPLKITVYDRYNKIYLLGSGTHIIKKDDYQYISFFSVNESMISLKHMVYPLNRYLLKYSDGLCVSNEIENEYGVVETTDLIFCIQSNTRGD